MARLTEMDSHVSLFQQMESATAGLVVLINKFDIAPEDTDQFMKAWTADAEIMKRQPGFISTQLHRGIEGSGVFVNYAVWETTEHFKRAFSNPEFQAKLKDYPTNAVGSPHLFRKIAVPGICVE
jgi:heme-degrading monooxygenase HmoA